MPSPFTKPRILSPTAATQVMPYAPMQMHGSEEEQVLPIHHYWWLLQRSWWKIAIAVATCTALTAAACFIVKPVYESTTRLTVDSKLPSSVLGPEGAPQGSTDIESFLTTEMSLIQSDSVLRPVAEKYHLMNPKQLANPAMRNAPVSLSHLAVAHPPNSLLLNISYRSTDPQLAADVANAVAHSYINNLYETRMRSSLNVSGFMVKQLDDLKANMTSSSQALSAYARQMGVVDPQQQTSIIGARVLQLNQDYTDAQNDRIRKQAAYRAIEGGNGNAPDATPEALNLARLQEQMQQAQQRLAQLKTNYGPNYPLYKQNANELSEITEQYQSARNQVTKRVATDYAQAASHETMLRDALAAAKAEADRLGANTVEYQQLKRDADANTTLYNELYQKIKEAGINSGFANSAVRIADEARPQMKPVFPKKGIFIFVGFFLSLVVSIIVVFLRDLLDKSVRDPEQARRSLHIDVLGTLPDVRDLYSAGRQLQLNSGSSAPVKVKPEPDWSRSQDAYTEAIRTMRSLILVERSRDSLRSLLVTSALAGEGKSSCTAHLAVAHAMQGRRTLLIDADLRRPSQHEHFALPNADGLAEMILNGVSVSDVCHKVGGVENLDVVTAGKMVRRASHLVGAKISSILKEATANYDLVLIDAPPMLGLAEPIQIACAADGVVLITQAGQTNQSAVANALSTLERLDVNVLGLVLNQVRRHMSSSYKQYDLYANYKAESSLSLG